MLIGHGGRGSGQAAQGHLVTRCGLAYLGWRRETHLPFPRRSDCGCHCCCRRAGRARPGTAGRVGRVPCAPCSGRWKPSVLPHLTSQGHSPPAHPATTQRLRAGGEKGWVLQEGLPSKGPRPRAQRAVPGGRQGRGNHLQLPSATFSFPDQAGRPGREFQSPGQTQGRPGEHLAAHGEPAELWVQCTPGWSAVWTTHSAAPHPHPQEVHQSLAHRQTGSAHLRGPHPAPAQASLRWQVEGWMVRWVNRRLRE